MACLRMTAARSAAFSHASYSASMASRCTAVKARRVRCERTSGSDSCVATLVALKELPGKCPTPLMLTQRATRVTVKFASYVDDSTSNGCEVPEHAATRESASLMQHELGAVSSMYCGKCNAASDAPNRVLSFVAHRSDSATNDLHLEAIAHTALSEILGVSEKLIITGAAQSPDVGCPSDRMNGRLSMRYGIYPRMPKDGRLSRRAVVMVYMSGCAGQFASGSIGGTGIGAEMTDSTTSSLVQDRALLFKALISALESFKASRYLHPSFAQNIIRYGIPLQDSERSALVGLDFENGEARVSRIESVGTAWRAGLRVGDQIKSIDGVIVTAENLASTVLAAESSGRWVVHGDKDVSFESQAPDWYVTHL